MKCSKVVELITSHYYTKNPLNKCSTNSAQARKMNDQIWGVGTKNFMPHKLWAITYFDLNYPERRDDITVMSDE